MRVRDAVSLSFWRVRLYSWKVLEHFPKEREPERQGWAEAKDRAAHESFSAAIAARLVAENHALSERWLERLLQMVPLSTNDVFPTAALLDHVPILIERIANFLTMPDPEIAGNTFVVAQARELGELRHTQNASVHQLLREYELLRNILVSFVVKEAKQLGSTPEFDETVQCLRRINQAVDILTQTTVDTFIERYTTTIREQRQRLEAFNQMVGHELRQPLDALQTAAKLLGSADEPLGTGRRERVVSVIEKNVTRLVELVTAITKVSTVRAAADGNLGDQRVSVSQVAGEAARQLRAMAQRRQVQVLISPDLPSVIAAVGPLELLLINLLSNAIKYADPSKTCRFVEVSPLKGNSDCAFRVRDNGLGMNPEQLRQIFTPFYRGHASRDTELGVEGLGLGLSIVRDCANALKASISVDSTVGEGTTFIVTMAASGGVVV